MCLMCNALNTIEYDVVASPPENGPLTVQDLEKTFDECWGTEDEGDEGFDTTILNGKNSFRYL